MLDGKGNRILYKKATAHDFVEIIYLLTSCNLPTSDLNQTKLTHFIVAKADEKVIGTIGLEYYGQNALLRSLAVTPEYRGKGIAKRLLKHIFQLAGKLHINSLHLLTTTAETYFLKEGFQKVQRDLAPAAIQNTVEFAELCPDSSVYLRINC